MRLSAYIVVTIATIIVSILAASYEIEKAGSVQWGLIKVAFDLLFLVPLELLALSTLAQVLDHLSQRIFGRLLKGAVLPVLVIVALVGLGFILFFVHALGGLPGVAH